MVTTAGDDTTYVITGDHRYAVPRGARGDATLRALGIDGSAATPVPGLWLDLSPRVSR